MRHGSRVESLVCVHARASQQSLTSPLSRRCLARADNRQFVPCAASSRRLPRTVVGKRRRGGRRSSLVKLPIDVARGAERRQQYVARFPSCERAHELSRRSARTSFALRRGSAPVSGHDVQKHNNQLTRGQSQGSGRSARLRRGKAPVRATRVAKDDPRVAEDCDHRSKRKEIDATGTMIMIVHPPVDDSRRWPAGTTSSATRRAPGLRYTASAVVCAGMTCFGTTRRA